MINSIKNAILDNKDVLIRVDLNVPFENGKVSDFSRITAIIPTLNWVLNKNGRPILLSHFGRPANRKDKELSLKKLLPALINALGMDILFCDLSSIEEINKFIKNTAHNIPILLENSRFFEGEQTNDPALSSMLSKLGSIFCNDAFSASHRAHASTVGIANNLPAYSGLLLEKELNALESALLTPTGPTVAVVGGAKVSTKITLLTNLVQKVDHIVIGGGMANTFLFAEGKQIGTSLCETKLTDLIEKIKFEAEKFNCKIHLPLDIVCAAELKKNIPTSIYNSHECPTNKMILDVGPKTIADISMIFNSCKTLIWNGPLGAFEIAPFNKATNRVAQIAATLTRENKLISIAGGGDTVSALNYANVASDFSYISNAGGAFLEWMEGKKLPGIMALEASAKNM